MSQPSAKPSAPRRNWLLSIPRSGFHLLTKLLLKQSKLSYSGYNFKTYIFTHARLLDQEVTLDKLPPADRDALLEDGSACWDLAVLVGCQYSSISICGLVVQNGGTGEV